LAELWERDDKNQQSVARLVKIHFNGKPTICAKTRKIIAKIVASRRKSMVSKQGHQDKQKLNPITVVHSLML